MQHLCIFKFDLNTKHYLHVANFHDFAIMGLYHDLWNQPYVHP